MTMVDCSLYPWSGVRALPALACTHALLGQVAEAEQALDMLVEPGRASPASGSVNQGVTNVFRLLPRMYADLPFEASVGCIAEHTFSDAFSDPYFLAPLCALIEIGDYTNTMALMDAPYQQLSQAFQGGVLLTSGWMFLLPRLLGLVEARHQRWDKSSSFFLKAIESATRIGAKPELARTYLDYARMLMTQDALCYYHQAIEYMEKALAIFHELNMQPFINITTSFIEKIQTRPTLLASLDLTEKDHLSTSETSLLQNAIQKYISFLR
jgi:hypothetical protein